MLACDAAAASGIVDALATKESRGREKDIVFNHAHVYMTSRPCGNSVSTSLATQGLAWAKIAP
jgi:hypothetical protein